MSKLIDLTGQSFGYWQVLSRGKNSKNGQAYWICKCTKCNETIKPVSGRHLRSGNSKACEKCRQKTMVNATIKNEQGKTYGFLYVEKMATEDEKPRKDRAGVYWNCTCLKCGRKNVIILGDYLRKGDTTSCGCINSKNESKICQMLDNMNIKYTQQKRFQDLSSTGRACDELIFDIAIYNQDTLLYLIEFDGSQHFTYTGSGWNTEENYRKTHHNDLLKNEYCFNNNIPLIRIPYDFEYFPNDLRLETTRFLLTPENEKEYYESRQ